MFVKRVVIAPHERGLYLVNRGVQKILMPGVYWIADLMNRVEIQTHDITDAEFRYDHVDALLQDAKALCDKHFTMTELNDHEVGLVYMNGNLTSIMRPGSRQLFWRGPMIVDVKVIDYQQHPAVPIDAGKIIARTNLKGLRGSAVGMVHPVEVADRKVGLMYVDGVFTQLLQPGLYVYWLFNRDIKVDQIDTRVQLLDVAGQEILTKDKVNLRINLSGAYQIVDPVQAREQLADIGAYVYREMQFALRKAVATRTLDVLLADKSILDDTIGNDVRAKLRNLGIEVKSVGIKDVIRFCTDTCLGE